MVTKKVIVKRAFLVVFLLMLIAIPSEVIAQVYGQYGMVVSSNALENIYLKLWDIVCEQLTI